MEKSDCSDEETIESRAKWPTRGQRVSELTAAPYQGGWDVSDSRDAVASWTRLSRSSGLYFRVSRRTRLNLSMPQFWMKSRTASMSAAIPAGFMFGGAGEARRSDRECRIT